MDFVIDPEFKDVIPPLAAEEFAALEKSIADHGCRDPLVVWKDGDGVTRLLDGHNRFAICNRLGKRFKIVSVDLPDRNAALCWIIDNQAGRRNISKFSLVELKLRKDEVLRRQAKENQRRSRGRGKKGSSMEETLRRHVDKAIAAEAGVSSATVYRVRQMLRHCRPDELDKVRAGDRSINETYKELRRRQRHEAFVERCRSRAREFSQQGGTDDLGVLHGDFKKIAAQQIEAGTVDLIFTDPPFSKESLSLYADLGRVAKRVLKPGGSLICFVPSYFLPQVISALDKHLQYFWVLACVHGGGNKHELRLAGKNLVNRWKPMLWYTNGPRSNRVNYVRDCVESEMDKTHHEWGQGVPEARYYIENVTLPGDLVFDPFCGGGTVLLAAAELHRQWIGTDIAKNACLTARSRLAAVFGQNERKNSPKRVKNSSPKSK